MIDVHWSDMTKTLDDPDQNGWIVLSNEHWELIMTIIDSLKGKHDRRNMMNNKDEKIMALSKLLAKSVMEKIADDICRKYCKFPDKCGDKLYDEHCNKCPLGEAWD